MKFVRLILKVVGLNLVAIAQIWGLSCSDCPPKTDYTLDGICYWYYGTTQKTFQQARAQCVADGGEMASIQDQVTYDNLWNHYGSLSSTWMGIFDARGGNDQERAWTLINGNPATWFKWNGDQPNGFGDDCLGATYRALSLSPCDDSIELLGQVTARSKIHCATACHVTEGNENIRWGPGSGLGCQLLGHIPRMNITAANDALGKIYTRYTEYPSNYYN